MIPTRSEAGSARYTIVPTAKSRGSTYTPPSLAAFVAGKIADAIPVAHGSGRLRILDPACGDGELLVALLAKLSKQGRHAIEAHGFDTDPVALDSAGARIRNDFPGVTLNLTHGDFLRRAAGETGNGPAPESYSPAAKPAAAFDLIIANPPYVRTQILGAEGARSLANAFALSGRVDLYHAFIIDLAGVLLPGGLAGIIVSNRFMTTKSGVTVRQAIRRFFEILHVWDLGDTQLFKAAVLPAVLLIRKKADPTEPLPAPRFTSIYRSTLPGDGKSSGFFECLAAEGIFQAHDGRRFSVVQGTLDLTTPPAATWRVSSRIGDDWLARVAANTWRRFGDLGKIRVGVKSCADSVFIRSDWDTRPETERPELLRTLTTHHLARPFRARQFGPSRQILYPHEIRSGYRQAVDLAEYPRARRYLEEYREHLERRRYVLEGGRHWYELWVPQDPAAWPAPKLVFRDISEHPMFWLDLDGSVVNGDCYWLSAGPDGDLDLLWLAAAVANSAFIERFYDQRFNNKLYAGRRRFITQYVEQFPLPDPALVESRELVGIAKEIYQRNDDEAIRFWSPVIERLLGSVFLGGAE